MQSPFSRSEKELLKQGYGVFLVTGITPPDETFYIYAAVKLDKLERFKECIQKRDEASIAKLNQDAHILVSGMGAPGPEALAKLKADFGISAEAITPISL